MRDLAAVTGATGGLGAAYARALAARGHDLLLTDRDPETLERLAAELRTSARVEVEVAAADLALDVDVERVQARLAARDDLALLVNNAGFGTFALFHEADLTRQLDMVHVHVVASLRLCHAVLPRMVARRSGAIVNVASAGAFMRFSRDATYIGTKSFLVAFTECLAVELAGTGVRVQAFCPLWVRTGFDAADDLRAAGFRSPVPGPLVISPERAVAASLAALDKGTVTYIPTARARVATTIIGSRAGRAVLAEIRKRRATRAVDPERPAPPAPPA